MKKILFIIDSYRVGGTTVSTRNLVGVLDKEKYTPYVWALSDSGILKDIYTDCIQVKTCFLIHALMLSSYKVEKRTVKRIFVMILRFLKNHSAIFKKVFFSLSVKKCLKGLEFDTVVACAEGETTDFVSCMKHPNKVAWVRCDYANYYSDDQIKAKRHQYSSFQHIVCVAEKAKEGFDKVYPEYSNKTICIHNPQDTNLLIRLAEINDDDARFKTDRLTIVSVGRIDSIKRFSLIPKIAASLMRKGLSFRWFIIGGGNEVELKNIDSEIERNKVGDIVILLGEKANPHYYIKHSDLLVSTSKSEACPRVVNEAKILHTPVVSADYRTIYEYIEDQKSGVISSIENIDEAIFNILLDKSLYNKISDNIANFSFENTELLQKLELVL